jgi:hypothetical protein
MVKGKRKHICGRVVIVSLDESENPVVLLDTYVRHPHGEVVNCLTRWSNIRRWMLDRGIPYPLVVLKVIEIIRGNILVTQNGNADFACLGLNKDYVEAICHHVELQSYFKRPDGSGYGLGPLVEYFKYESDGSPVIINHDCIQDATYTLKLYNDHYVADGTFLPDSIIPSVKMYRLKHSL